MAFAARTQRLISIGMAGVLLFAGVLGIRLLLHRENPPLMQRIERAGILVVATRRGQTTYFDGANGPDGFEYALVKQFAKAHKLKIKFVFPDTLDELLHSVERGHVHLAAADLTITHHRSESLRFSHPYAFVEQQLVYRRGTRLPRSITEVPADAIQVVASSSHEEKLQAMQTAALPKLSWTRLEIPGAEPLLAGIDAGTVRFTMANSNEIELVRRLYKYVATAFEIGDARPVAWAMRRSDDTSLVDAVNRFLDGFQQSGRLSRLHARYYGHAGRLNFVDTREFWRHVRDRLPLYRELFEQAGEESGIDWRLLAAIGYQESHWRADAVSPTGVRGIMMLTQSTARQVGIEDRNDPQQSISGGAKYLRLIERRIPDRIDEPNRLWLTLAGYNVGFGHLEDARVLTERDGANPDLWLEVKRRLPWLAQKQYYSTVRHGHARGREPVDYVDNIRNYYDLLVWYTNTDDHASRDRLTAIESPSGDEDDDESVVLGATEEK